MSWLSKLFNPIKGNLTGWLGVAQAIFDPIGFTIGAVSKGFQSLIKSLIPDVNTEQGGTGARSVYSLATSNEVPKPGDPKPWLFGKPLIYPLVLQRYARYVNNKQLTYILLFIADHKAACRELRFSDTPITALASFRMQEAWPGERIDLANFNVYASDKLNGVELIGGALDLVPFDVTATFAPIDSETGTIAIDDGGEPFGTATVGGRLTVTGTADNDIEFTVVSITDSTHAVVTPTPTAESGVECTINVYKVTASNATAYLKSADEVNGIVDSSDTPVEVPVVFDAANSSIQGPLQGSWSDFQVGDVIQAYKSAANDKIDYRIEAFWDNYAIVSPAPVAGSDTCAIVLVSRRFGPSPLCAPGQTINGFDLHVSADNGLYTMDGKGKLQTLQLGIEVQIQRIDDAGNVLGPITSLGETIVSGKSRTPQRRSLEFRGLLEARYQIFVSRVTPASDDVNRADLLRMLGTTGYVVPGAVDIHEAGTGTLMALEITATSALSGQQQKIQGIWQPYHPLLIDGVWTAPRATNDIAPAWAALRRARGFEIDADAYAENHAAWRDADYEYHGYLTGAVTLADATKSVLQCGGAAPWYDWPRNVDTIWRDQLSDGAAWCLHDGNVDASTMDDKPFGLLPEDVATGVIAQYSDARTGETREVECPAGASATARPETVQYAGVQSRQQAYELGTRELRRRQLRQEPMSATVLWQQVDLDFGAAGLVQSYQHRMGQIAYAAAASGVLVIADRDFAWDATAQHRVWFVDRRGIPSAPILCSKGIDDRTMILESAPPAINLGEDGDDATVLILGYPGHEPRMAIVTSVAASDADYKAQVGLTLDDPAIFDPIGPAPPDPYPVAGEPPDLDITDLAATVDAQTITATWTPPAEAVASIVEYRLQPSTSWTALPPTSGGIARIDVTVGGTYEVRVRALGPAGAIGIATDAVEAEVIGLPLSVALSRSAIYCASRTANLVSATVTATISGGVPPYTGAWVRQSGNVTVLPIDATNPTTAFATSIAIAGDTKTAVYRYSVEDSASGTAESGDLAVEFERLENSGPSCVHVDSLLPGAGRAGDVRVGDYLLICDAETDAESWARVSYSQRVLRDCVRVRTASVTLVCSVEAPIPTRDGLVLAPDLLGKEVPVKTDAYRWETVIEIEPVGELPVQHITVGNQCFWAGERDEAYMLHHNKMVP